jgi:hypothetical protein
MVESEAGRVQKLALESEVAWNDGGQVDADLVRPPGLEANAEQRMAREELDDVEVRHSFAWRGRIEGDSCRVGAVASDRGLDTTVLRARPAANEGQVLPLDPPLAKQPLQAAVGFVRAGHHE